MINIKALVIGATGFVGSYLIEEIKNSLLCDIIATNLEREMIYQNNIILKKLDILDYNSVFSLINENKPEYIFHLAAQSSVSLAWKKPELTADININGSLNILEAVKNINYNPKILMIGSGEEYGYIEKVPIVEETPLKPGNIYAVTKACQNMISKVYCKAYDMKVIMVRSFNHIGPNQSSTFVISDFCKQVAEIEKGVRSPILKVGNLNAKRDFLDVRDVVRAYTKLIQFGKSGETYNVGRGQSIKISEVLNIILKNSNKEINVEIDKNKLRPLDVPIIEPSINKIYTATGWKPEISLEESIKDILTYWRKNI
ncbi:GDP-6-deoxy-D-mannose reductase [Leptotrichia shahii]|uniref:GDP-6-deoxy-D-mannose reductase n=1 Tax=Leptotrichia shahii TaxID=157691 RepID=A0A510JQM3_9FUSO|nr:GDP-mannose 4,6-dehydratase [Leptotrichia shahii]BBM41660.1 GDP-6-deoxy-D-mannose reductase [Leptotrichia shahii]